MPDPGSIRLRHLDSRGVILVTLLTPFEPLILSASEFSIVVFEAIADIKEGRLVRNMR